MRKSEINEVARAVGKAIARQRLRAGLTQESVAESLGIGNEAVSRMERGLVVPTIGRLVTLAQLFGCDVSLLLLASSPRATEQALYLDKLLSPLTSQDRMMVVAMIETLSKRLTTPPSSS